MHFIKVQIDADLVSTPYVSSSNCFIDVLTKGLSIAKFVILIHQLEGVEGVC